MSQLPKEHALLKTPEGTPHPGDAPSIGDAGAVAAGWDRAAPGGRRGRCSPPARPPPASSPLPPPPFVRRPRSSPPGGGGRSRGRAGAAAAAGAEPSAAQRDMEASPAEPAPPAPPPPPPLPERKKKPQRAPSPARPKEVPGWSLAKSRRGGGGGHPGAAPRAAASGAHPHPHSHPHSRRPGGGKDGRPDKRGPPGTRTGGKGPAGRGAVRPKGRRHGAETAAPGARRTGSGPRSVPGPGAGSGLTDSSSEVSDCSASEEAKLLSLELGLSGSDGESPGSAPPPPPSAGEASPLPEEPSAASMASSRLQLSTSLAFSDLTEELLDAGTDGLLRELEDLRSENDYLKVGTAWRGIPGTARGGCCPWAVVAQRGIPEHGSVRVGILGYSVV